MKHYFAFKSLFVALFAIFLFTSCHDQSQEQRFHVTPLPDNAQPHFMPTQLFTQVTDSLIEKLGIQQGIPSSVCSILLEIEDKAILFDTGNGAEQSQLIPLLEEKGLTTDDIDYIFITHLHGDHIGGLISDNEAVFNQATLYIPSKEYYAWMEMPENRNANIKEIAQAYNGNMELFDEKAPLPCGIKPITAYGHTPGHTLYQIGNTLIVGDLMHGVALQLEDPNACARFDMDTEQAIQSRKSILQKAKEEQLTLYGMHFPEPYLLDFKQ